MYQEVACTQYFTVDGVELTGGLRNFPKSMYLLSCIGVYSSVIRVTDLGGRAGPPPPPLGDVLTPSLAHMFARLMLNCDRSVVKFRIFKMIAGTSGFLTAFGCTKFVLGRDSAPGQLEELS